PSSLELQRLVLEKFLEAVDAGLAAVARLLEAAEGRVHVEGAAVHVHLPGADAARDALRARVVPGPHRARQAVHRVVGDAHRVFLVLVGNDGQHRAEDFLAGDGHVVPHSAEHGGLHVVAARRHALGRLGAAREEFGALLQAFPDVAAHALELRLRAERPQPGGFGERVNEIMSMSRCLTSASPASAPKPVTRLKTPCGRPAASIASARMKALNGATSEGLSTTVQPAASAGATLSAIWCSG